MNSLNIEMDADVQDTVTLLCYYSIMSFHPHHFVIYFISKVKAIKNKTILYFGQRWAHPSQFVVSNGAGVHKGLGDDGQHGVHVVWGLHVKDELWVLEDIDPEPQW